MMIQVLLVAVAAFCGDKLIHQILPLIERRIWRGIVFLILWGASTATLFHVADSKAFWIGFYLKMIVAIYLMYRMDTARDYAEIEE